MTITPDTQLAAELQMANLRKALEQTDHAVGELREENQRLRLQLRELQKPAPAKPERSFIKPWEMGSGWSYRVSFDSVYDEADSLIARVIDADRRGEPTDAALNIVIEEIDPIGGSDE